MAFPRTVRYSTLVRLIFPVILVSLLVIIFYIVMLDLVFTMAQGLNGSGQYDQQPEQLIEDEQIKTLVLEKHVLEASVRQCRVEKTREILETTKYFKEENEKLKKKLKVYELLERRQSQPKIPTKRKDSDVLQHQNKFDANNSRVTIDREFFNYLTANLRNTSYPGTDKYTKYAVARLGLSPLVNIEPLIPEFGPVINDVVSFRYPISIPPCHDLIVDSSVAYRRIFIAVMSAVDNFHRRKIIRQTWKNHLTSVDGDGLLEIVGFAFVLGLTEDNLTQSQIEEEVNTYGDIIQIEMADFYRNLSLKGIAVLNWVNRFCAKVDFFLKVDDDVYVNVRNLAQFVQTHHQLTNKSIFGVGKPRFGWPDRDDKWEMSFEEWPWNQYPSYILGAMVLISGKSVLSLLAACQTTPIVPMEDVYFYGICAKKAGIEIHYSTGPTRSLIGSIIRAPTTCELRMLIAWRVDFHDFTKLQEIMHSSHETVDDFYRNATQCVISTPISSNIGVDDVTPVGRTKTSVYFNFTTSHDND